MITSDRKARMMLSCAIDGGITAVAELVQNLGAEGAWAKIIEGALGEPIAHRAAQVTVDVFERLAEAAAARFIVPGDEEWPAGLDDLRHAESIQRRGGEPFGLWLRGPVVGSRAATAYGNGIAADLAADLVEQGVTVLSGGAFGIDVAAHRGALAAGGRPCAYLRTVSMWPIHQRTLGSLRPWPRISCWSRSYRPVPTPLVSGFWRVTGIAAMSGGTVLVEAALRSGARNTASWAFGCGRPLMAVPGSV
jgi:DNA processing protein